jgi:hypothetical protein
MEIKDAFCAFHLLQQCLLPGDGEMTKMKVDVSGCATQFKVDTPNRARQNIDLNPDNAGSRSFDSSLIDSKVS